MESLKELIKLITKRRVKKIELFDETSRNKSSNYFRLFDGIHSEKYLTDELAAQDIYDCSPTKKKYLILKTRLRQKLLNTVFFLNFDEDGDTITNASYDCFKSLYAAKILIINHSYHIALPIVYKTLKRAEEFQLTEIEWDCAKILREYYSNNNLYKEFLHYNEICEELEIRFLAENESDKYFQELNVLYSKAKLNKSKLKKTAEKYYKLIEGKSESLKSFKLTNNYYKMKMLFHQYSDDYSSAVNTALETETFLKAHEKFQIPGQFEELIINTMIYYLHLKNFDNGIHYFERNGSHIPIDSENWYKFMQIGFLLSMHTGNHIKAAQIFLKVMEQPSFRIAPQYTKDIWKTFHAYLHFIYKSQKVKDIRPYIQNTKTPFHISDFMKEKPDFLKETRGLNIANLSIQLLLSMEKMEIESIRSIVTYLEEYSRRYPKKDLYFRSENFINMVKIMVEEEFRFYQTRRTSEKIFEDMSETMMEYTGDKLVLEVLPYEVMWNMILDNLKAYKYG